MSDDLRARRLMAAERAVRAELGKTGACTADEMCERGPCQCAMLAAQAALAAADAVEADHRQARMNAAQSAGGKARAAKLSPERRSEIAHMAAWARWHGG